MGASESNEEKSKMQSQQYAKKGCFTFVTRHMNSSLLGKNHPRRHLLYLLWFPNELLSPRIKCEDEGPELGSWHIPSNFLC